MEVPVVELEKLIGNLNEENYSAVVKFVLYLSHEQGALRQGKSARRIGAGKGKFVAPSDLDSCNEEVASLFGVE